MKNKQTKKKTKKVTKFAFGGTAMNTLSPQEMLFNIIRASEESGIEASANPLVMGLKTLGTGLTSAGSSGVMSGVNSAGGWSKVFGEQGAGITKIVPGAEISKVQQAENGGLVSSNKIEVEGEEAFETPNGQFGTFKGPSHDQGGIPLKVKGKGVAKDGELPDGTFIYPKKFKIKDPKTGKKESMADRAKKRENKESKLKKYLEGSSDKILKDTLARTQTNNNNQDTADKLLWHQDQIKRLSGNKSKSVPEFEEGGFLDALNINSASMPTMGDSIGMLGNLFQAFMPLQNTLKQRRGDTPNINPYADYGQKALELLEGQKQELGIIQDNQEQSAALSRNAAFNRNNNSARGINTIRGLNLATDAQYNELDRNISSDFAAKNMALIDKIANTELEISGRKAQGEQYRDLSDRQDRDAFFSNINKDYQTLGEGIARTGKNINQLKERGVQQNFMNMLTDFVSGNVMTGKITQKEGIEHMATSVQEQFDTWLETKYKPEYIASLNPTQKEQLKAQFLKEVMSTTKAGK